MDVRVVKVNLPEPQPKNLSKEVINKLNDSLAEKESLILRVENQAKKMEAEWKLKYDQMEKSKSSLLQKKEEIIK